MLKELLKLKRLASRSTSAAGKCQRTQLFRRISFHEYNQIVENGTHVLDGVTVTAREARKPTFDLFSKGKEAIVSQKPTCLSQSPPLRNNMAKDLQQAHGPVADILVLGQYRRCMIRFQPLEVTIGRKSGGNARIPSFSRFISSRASEQKGQTPSENKKDLSTVEDPFDAPTYNIPEKPVTFAEGASYSVIILVGLGIAAAAGYAVFKELIFQPKEYKIFDKALKRIQDDSQVRVRIGSPITGYGQESKNRAARQRIPNRVWTDEDGVERVEVNFYIRGPHGAGKVFTEMFKDQADKQWKFTYLIVEIKSPSPAQLILESYMPA